MDERNMKESIRRLSDHQRGRILVVEDDVATALEILGTLEAHAFQVTHVTTGLEALSCLASSEYDAITLDRMLPDTDGVMVVRSLREAKHVVPVLMLSSLSDVDERV